MKKVIQERLQEYGLTTYEKLEASSEVDSVLNEIKCMGGKDFCHVIEVFSYFLSLSCPKGKGRTKHDNMHVWRVQLPKKA